MKTYSVRLSWVSLLSSVAVLVLGLGVSGCESDSDGGSGGGGGKGVLITDAEYNQILNRMSWNQVMEIVKDAPTERTGYDAGTYTIDAYQWRNSDGSSAGVTIQSGIGVVYKYKNGTLP